MQPEFNIWLWLGSMTMATTAFAMAHNHNHEPMWKSKFMNILTDYWLTIFYGFPVYAWIPTHNQNHHVYNNRPGDNTITWRFSEKNNLFTLLSYPIISAIYQQEPTSNFLKHHWKNNKGLFFYYISQYVLLIAFDATAFYLDPFKALMYVLIPQLFSTQFVLIINYVQHVHCDEESKYNHSRNFVGLGSRFLLNAGFHTAHHEEMNLHWSKLPELHRKLEPHIDPSLNHRSLAWFLFKTYILGIFIPSCRTRNMRMERIQKEQGQVTTDAALAS